MDDDREGEVVHEGWLIKSPPLETKTRQIFSQTLIQPVGSYLMLSNMAQAEHCYYHSHTLQMFTGLLLILFEI